MCVPRSRRFILFGFSQAEICTCTLSHDGARRERGVFRGYRLRLAADIHHGPPSRTMSSAVECVWTLAALIYRHVFGFIYLPAAEWEGTICLMHVPPVSSCQKDSHTLTARL